MSSSETFFTESTLFRGKHVHLAVTGSVACYRALDLLRALKRCGVYVSVTLTQGARAFVTPLLFESLGAMPVYTEMTGQEPDCFAHLAPGQQADVLVVAPASAGAIGRMANGLCTDLFSTQALAFSGPLVVAPAMNPRMWMHPALQANIALLSGRGAHIVLPDSGGTACGDEGRGRLAQPVQIFWSILKAMTPQDMEGKKVLVTLGPTREFWDGVRFWSNPSTGRMGTACVLAAWMRGAEVYALTGPSVAFTFPDGVTQISVTDAREMYGEAEHLWPGMDMGICTAAVSDFAPRPYGDGRTKYKKSTGAEGADETLSITFDRNPDILMRLSETRRTGQKLLAFAAETVSSCEELCLCAREKRRRKGADLLAANSVSGGEAVPATGFASHTNQVCVADARGEEIWPVQSKTDVAWRLCSWLLRT